MGAFTEVLSVVGFVIRALGFVLLGFAVARFTIDAYKAAAWQATCECRMTDELQTVGCRDLMQSKKLRA